MMYSFNLIENGEVSLDQEGAELPDLATARQIAIAAARGIIAADVMEGVMAMDRSIEITDSAGTALMVLPFVEAVTVKPLAM